MTSLQEHSPAVEWGRAERSASPGPAGSILLTTEIAWDGTAAALGGARRARRRRIASYALTLWVLLTLNFLLPRVMPGDPLTALQDPTSQSYVQDQATRVALAHYYGLDQPLALQYGRYLGGLVHGDLGSSIRYGVPVGTLLAERAPWTLLLVLTATVLATAVGTAAGIHSGWRRGRAVDGALLALFLGIRNFPAFFLGSLALFVLAVTLHWFPLGGATTPFASFGPLHAAADVAYHLVLPASVLAVQFAAGHYLVMRAGMVGELGAEYLLLGQAKGLRDRRLKYAYAARNALLPVVSLTAAQVGFAVTGSIFVETVFAYPGIGRLIFDSVAYRDYPVLQGCFLLLTVAVVSANFLGDLLNARLDPRSVA